MRRSNLVFLAIVGTVLAATILMMAAQSPAFCAPRSALALLDDVRGRAAIMGANGKWEDATILTHLYDGARLRIADNSTVVLKFRNRSKRDYVQGPSEITVRSNGLHFAPLARSVASTTFNALRATRRKLPMRTKTLMLTQRGLRLTSFSVIDTAQPTLSWIADLPLTGLEITVAPASGNAAPLAKQTVPAQTGSFNIPGRLDFGARYRITLTAIAQDGKKLTKSDTLVLLPRDKVDRLQRQRKDALSELTENPSDASPLSELLEAYVEERVDGRTLEIIDKIIALRNDPGTCKDLYLKKIEILTERGLGDMAQKVYDEYRRAVDASN